MCESFDYGYKILNGGFGGIFDKQMPLNQNNGYIITTCKANLLPASNRFSNRYNLFSYILLQAIFTIL